MFPRILNRIFAFSGSLVVFLAGLIAFAGFTTTPVLADFGASSGTSCKSGYRWCAKKSKCVNARCKRGKSWSSSACKCVKRSSSLMNDEDLLTEAIVLAKKEHNYQEALDMLHMIKNQNTAPVLNFIGYTTRKLGRIDEGLKYYHKALAINPKYTLAREYLGEGLLMKGDVKGAKMQLAEIEKLCGKKCHEYEDLAEDIKKFEAGRKKS